MNILNIPELKCKKGVCELFLNKAVIKESKLRQKKKNRLNTTTKRHRVLEGWKKEWSNYMPATRALQYTEADAGIHSVQMVISRRHLRVVRVKH